MKVEVLVLLALLHALENVVMNVAELVEDHAQMDVLGNALMFAHLVPIVVQILVLEIVLELALLNVAEIVKEHVTMNV